MRKRLPLFITFLIASVAGILLVEVIDYEKTDLKPQKVTSESTAALKMVDVPAPDKRDSAATPMTLPQEGVRVVLVSVDGFRTDLVAYMPRFRKMMKDGAWTLRATTTIPSITTTAHASMFTGQPPEVHGVKSGAPRGPAIKSWHPLKVKTIFETLDQDYYKPTAFVQKEKLLRLLPEHMLAHKVLDRATRESVIVKGVCDEVAKPDGSRMLIVHLKRFDAAGHDEGWMSRVQISASEPIDHALLAISQCISEAQAPGENAFALIVTADHGGSGYDHDTRKETDMHIPWLIIGPGVKKDHEIRRDMHVMDTAAVIRHFLGHGEKMHEGIRARFPREILAH